MSNPDPGDNAKGSSEVNGAKDKPEGFSKALGWIVLVVLLGAAALILLSQVGNGRISAEQSQVAAPAESAPLSDGIKLQ